MKKTLPILFLIIISVALHTQAQNMVFTYSGNGTAALNNGPLATAEFNQPFGICRDKNGIIYVADTYNNCIRKIENGMVSTYAGSTIAGYLDGPALTAKFNQPLCLCVDDSGNLFVTDFVGQRVRKVSYSGNVTTVAGDGVEGFIEGADTSARFDYPRGITIDALGNLFVADSWNHRIRKIDASTHEVSTYAGGGTVTGVQTPGGYVDASDTSARFHTPCGVVIDSVGIIYVADALNHRIRMIDTQRQVTTIAGSGTTGGFLDGAVLTARLNTPTDLYRAVNGDIFIGDTYNNRMRLLSGGMLSTIAGIGTAGFVNGVSTIARFNYPRGIIANVTADSIWVIDYNNNAIRLITVQPTEISEQETKNILVYPNPFHDRINIQLSNEKISSKIILMDVKGKIILEQELKNKMDLELNTNNLMKGIYVLRFEGLNFSLYTKIVKE